MNKWLDFTALILYCGLIYWLSNQETLPMPMLFSFQDKFHHAGAYFVMSLFAIRYVRHFENRRFAQAFIVIGFCSFYGATDEWHQSFVEGRNSDILDWAADTVGACLGVLIIYKFNLKTNREKM